MLVLFLSSLIIILLFSSSVYLWPILCGQLLLFFISQSGSVFLSSLSYSQSFVFSDTTSVLIAFLLFLIIFIAYVNAFEFHSFNLISLVFFSLTFFCLQVFTTSHLFNLYFSYEASLIPILYIIINWGSYPERSVSAIIILVYTLLFGAPVLILIIYIYIFSGSWLLSIYLFSGPSSLLLTLLIFLCFAVKLPIYGLHFWLPIAHVEAPTFGSVILASILLNLGGVGLLRLSDFLNIYSITYSILSYFIIFIIYSSLVCCYQSDLKRLIAYSSVAHMMAIPFLVLSNNHLAVQSLVLIIILHGLSSTLLFISVGLLYSIFSTRQLVLIRGLILVSPIFSFILVLTFLFTLSAPPMPSYVAEVFFILSSFSLSPYILYVVILFAFLGLVYNLNWLMSTMFSTNIHVVYSFSGLKFSHFMPLIYTLLGIFPFSTLFFILWGYCFVLFCAFLDPLWECFLSISYDLFVFA